MNIKKPISLLAAASLSFAANAQVVLINPFTVPEGHVEETLVFWETARDFLQEEDGYVSTNLHKALSEGATFEFINVAIWASEDSFKKATGNMQAYFKENGIKAPEGVKNDPALYQVIRN